MGITSKFNARELFVSAGVLFVLVEENLMEQRLEGPRTFVCIGSIAVFHYDCPNH